MADQQYGWQDDLFGDAQWKPQTVEGTATTNEAESVMQYVRKGRADRMGLHRPS